MGRSKFYEQFYLLVGKQEVWKCAVSLGWLFAWVETRKAQLQSLTTQEVVNTIVVPETSAKCCRYVDLIAENEVSSPYYFASHVWGAPFLDLVDTLREFFKDSECASVFIWIDIFAINQHPTTDKTDDLTNLHLAVRKSLFGTLVCLDRGGQLLKRYFSF